MVNRTKISYDGEELTHHLKQSTGRGVDAFFPEQSPAPPQPAAQTIEPPQQAVDTDTHARTGARMSKQAETSDEVSPDASMDAEVPAQMRAHTRARMAPPTDVPDGKTRDSAADEAEGDRIAAIRKMIRVKRHLSTFTFRFRANELEELDLVVDELNQDDEQKVIKNDAVRTALNWLLADYKARKQESILARVLTDT